MLFLDKIITSVTIYFDMSGIKEIRRCPLGVHNIGITLPNYHACVMELYTYTFR